MAWGEPLLQAAVVLAPLLGLIGTTAGLMAVLKQLGSQLLLPPRRSLSGLRRRPASHPAWSADHFCGDGLAVAQPGAAPLAAA
jgi:hypothetical protein